MSSHTVGRVSPYSCHSMPVAVLAFNNSLEGVELVLPPPIQLHPHLDTSENHLLATLEVDSKLHNIAIVDWERFAFLRWRTQSNVIEKRARRALDILDEPLAILVPEFAVPSTHHLTLEADRGGRGLVSRHASHGRAVPLRVSAHSNCLGAGRKRP